jgi:hypothetical protein
MSSQNTPNLSKLTQIISNFNDQFKSYLIILLSFAIIISFICYLIYLSRLNNNEVNYMNTLYSSLDGNIAPITSNNPDFSGNLRDYYIKSAYNACSGGNYSNDFVNSNNLKAIIKQGVRCLDFEIYSINDEPVVATSIINDYYVKQTYNSVPFDEVMSIINTNAFSAGTCPNPTDPLIIHLRFQSSNQEMYTNLASIFKLYDDIMLGSSFSYENKGHNLGKEPLLTFQNKVILIVDKTNNSFLENDKILEYINLTSNSVFMRAYNYNNVKDNPDVQELTTYNKQDMTIVFPINSMNPTNPSGPLCRAYGCQMVAMRYQYIDNFLEENTAFFDETGHAFCLKPANLRYEPVTIPDPTPQNPNYSYETRTSSTDYYSFKY